MKKTKQIVRKTKQIVKDCHRYHRLFMASNDAVMTLEPPSWKFSSGNPAALKMFKMKTEAEFVACELWKLSPRRQPDGRFSSEKAKKMIAIAMDKGSNSFEWVHKRKNGDEFFADVLLSKVKEGRFFFLHAIVRDIDEHKKMELALMESEVKFRNIFNELQEGVLIVDAKSKKFYMGNKAICKMLGYSLEEIKKLCVKDIHPKKELCHVLPKFEKQVKGELVVAKELPVKRKDGSIFYADVKVSVIKIAGKSYAVGFFNDITQRRELEKIRDDIRNAKEKIILEAIGDGVVAFDESGKIILFNKVASGISGFSSEEVVGKHYSEFLSFMKESTNEPAQDFIAQAILKGKPTVMANHVVIVRKDGERVPVADSVSPFFDKVGKVFGCVLVFRDVTREREIDRVKTEFVSFASHQLRTPLSAINWYTEMLLSGDIGVVNSCQRDYLENIYHSNRRMVDLINSLLNVSRLEFGVFAIEPRKIDVIKLANDIIDENDQRISDRRLVVVRKFEKNILKLPFDKNLLSIIFQNLLVNAIKYTPEKGIIKFSISLVGKKDIRIEISDSGCGISKDQQSKVFSKFFRGDNVVKKNTEGTGLGLYIAKMIVEHAGGKIWFKSPVSRMKLKRNPGTAFYVEFPLSGMKKREGTKSIG